MKAQFPTIEGLHEKDILSAYAIKCLTGKGVGWIVKVCIFGGCFQTALFYFNFHEKVEKGFYIFSNTGCVFWRTSKNADFFLTIRKKCKNSTQNMLFSLISPLCCDCLDVDCSCQNIESSAKASTTCYFCPEKSSHEIWSQPWIDPTDFFGFCGLWRLDVSSIKFLLAMLFSKSAKKFK